VIPASAVQGFTIGVEAPSPGGWAGVTASLTGRCQAPPFITGMVPNPGWI